MISSGEGAFGRVKWFFSVNFPRFWCGIPEWQGLIQWRLMMIQQLDFCLPWSNSFLVDYEMRLILFDSYATCFSYFHPINSDTNSGIRTVVLNFISEAPITGVKSHFVIHQRKAGCWNLRNIQKKFTHFYKMGPPKIAFSCLISVAKNCRYNYSYWEL